MRAAFADSRPSDPCGPLFTINGTHLSSVSSERPFEELGLVFQKYSLPWLV